MGAARFQLPISLWVGKAGYTLQPEGNPFADEMGEDLDVAIHKPDWEKPKQASFGKGVSWLLVGVYKEKLEGLVLPPGSATLLCVNGRQAPSAQEPGAQVEEQGLRGHRRLQGGAVQSCEGGSQVGRLGQ